MDKDFKGRFRERLLANGLFALADAGHRDSQERIAMRYIAGRMRSYFPPLQRFEASRIHRGKHRNPSAGVIP